MPLEVRLIILSDEELKQAAQCYRRVTPGFLPDGEILVAEVDRNGGKDGAGEVRVGVSIRPADGPPITATVTGIELTEMLIRFCIENNIPVPRKGDKTIDIQERRLVLRIDFKSGLPPSALTGWAADDQLSVDAV